ncbi:MAG: FliI/YscN family ATPase [Edaphobacter sp.]|uniref:FliI/YscN family ATPase n=1 Tax=Edaphobacter sp. TaxID=1934404 RepID=UPI00238D9F7D|nr:FliI/YscN family ATPase [Edaphobacter sp.]MDE1178373.1 FliI/YscN family ATPase [Edaphobacter sp.]
MSGTLAPYFARLKRRPSWRWSGRVVEANGQTLESEGPLCSVGECCEVIDAEGEHHAAEVIGFRGRHVLAMPLEATRGIRYGDALEAMGESPTIAVSEELQGRILNAVGDPLDGIAAPKSAMRWPLDGRVPDPMERLPIREALGTGVRVIDGLLTVGRGQRIGIFGGSGVGKSTLIGMMTRNTQADLTVVALVGERGREVREFVEDSLGEEGLRRSVVLVSTSDQSPLLRMRAAQAATAVAEFYAAQGRHVLLVLDSLTRYAMAAREIGLAAGEPPTSKGYTPSVFSRLAKLVERTGNFERGSITAFYTVLMEGDDQQDPIVDSVRSYVDGHVVLSRALAGAGRYPPVDVVDSLSRLMPAVTTRRHQAQATTARSLLAAYARSEDLMRIGAYKAGTDPELDRAIRALPVLKRFLEQESMERPTLDDAIERLCAMEL